MLPVVATKRKGVLLFLRNQEYPKKAGHKGVIIDCRYNQVHSFQFLDTLIKELIFRRGSGEIAIINAPEPMLNDLFTVRATNAYFKKLISIH